ncbi:MAG: SoxR reducing system RseC family protein [Bacteroidales bacterium]
MGTGSIIEHPGIVSKVEKDRVVVTILAQSACHSCHAKGSCSMGGEENKEVEFFNPSEEFRQGEQVNIVMQESTGMMAMVLGYLVPFLILILALIILIPLTGNEGIAALATLGIIAVYYLALYFLKGKLAKKLTFRIEKI